MIELLRLINKEQDKIEEELSQEDEHLKFFDSFFETNGCSNLTECINASHADLAIAIILYRNPNVSVDKVKDVVYKNRAIFEDLSNDTTGDFVKFVDFLLQDKEIYERLKGCIIQDKKLSKIKHRKEELKAIKDIKYMIDIIGSTPEDYFNLIDLFETDGPAICNALAIISTLRDIKERRELNYFLVEDYSATRNVKFKNKEKDKKVAEMIRDDFDVVGLLSIIHEAREAYLQLKKNEKIKKRNLVKTKNIYETLSENIYNAVQKGEIRNIKSLIEKVPNEEIRLKVLKLVYEHNSHIYSQLTTEYRVLSANDSSHYQVLLAKYGVSPDTYEVGTVMNNSIEDLEKILKVLSKLRITDAKNILNIIQNTDLETIINIQTFTENGIITSELIQEHKNIFNPNSTEYENIMRNISFITQKKINPHSFAASQEILIASPQKIVENITALEDYELIQNIKTGMDLNFLNKDNLNEAIDILLELGYEKNLEECLELLNYKDRFKRLQLLKTLNIPVSDTKTLIDILSTDKFYTADEEISNYIYNATQYKLPKGIIESEDTSETSEIAELNAYNETNRTYSFDGVRISKNKVKRNLSHVLEAETREDRLIYSVLKDSVLTDDEVEKIINCITTGKTSRTVKQKQ